MHQHITEPEIDRYIDGTTTSAERAELSERVASCEVCRVSWQAILQSHDALSHHRFEVPDALVERQLARVSTTRGPARTRWRSAIMQAAALVFAAGLGAAAATFAAKPGADTIARGSYLLLLSGSRANELSAAERGTIGRAFAQWTDSLSRAGVLDTQAQLDRVALTPVASNPIAMDRSTVGALGLVEGFYLVRARNDEDALAVARSSPYLRYGGTIVIRKRRSAAR